MKMKMKKSFVITIDTESDNQWNVNNNQSTENALYIPRFQELCEKYDFKPVYLVDYSMANNNYLVEYLSSCYKRGMCEIGMHLHAWDTPPFVEMDKQKTGRPYLIEYSLDIMEEKIATLDKLLKSKFGETIISHRAGRWAMNDMYFALLKKYGYKIDCSYTPGINWEKVIGASQGGADYSNETGVPFFDSKSGILEVPATVKKIHYMKQISPKELVKLGFGRNVWLRPALFSNKEMLTLVNKNKSNIDEFMMHSSELMPGGSPYFKAKEDIENLYSRLDQFFLEIHKSHKGSTLAEVYKSVSDKRKDNLNDF